MYFGHNRSIPKPELTVFSVKEKVEVEVILMVNGTTVAKFFIDLVNNQDALQFGQRR